MRSSHAFVGTGLDTIPEPEQREFRPRSERILSANRENYRLNRACSQSRPNRAMAYWAMSATHGPGALNKYTNGRSDRVLLAARGPYGIDPRS